MHIFILKQNGHKENETQHYLGRKGKDKVGLIKSLIYTRVGRGALRGML